MKGSLTSATAIAQGLKGWVTRRQAPALADIESPETEVVSTCGQPDTVECAELETRREFDEPRDRWPLGPSVDNYS